MIDSHNDLPLSRSSLDIPIFQKTYELYKLFYQYLVNFPKIDRYTLGVRCENALLDLLEGLTLASQLQKPEKLQVLQKASMSLDHSKILIRLCKDLKILDNKKYLILESNLQEIGKMLGGWIKSVAS